jgi:DNA-binding NtrC family response regulator
VKEGTLREDLLYRLNVFPIALPPLRERDGDVELLAHSFLGTLNEREQTEKRFTPEALERLKRLPWPGNVRELKNVVERAAILADEVIDLDVLPEPDGTDGALAASGRGRRSGDDAGEGATLRVRVGSSIAEAERRLVLATLEELDGDKKRAAEILGISLKTLYNRLNVYEASRSRKD